MIATVVALAAFGAKMSLAGTGDKGTDGQAKGGQSGLVIEYVR